MAQMYPNRLVDVPSQAESLLYEVFRDQLDEEYVVFHSVHWQALDGDGRPRDGEADFIIAHPRRGILILEVKGGRIAHDPRSGDWASTDRAGQTHAIKDPFYQARTSKYALLDQLKRMLGQAERRINVGHAVAFPDVVAGRALPGLDRLREIVLDEGDLANVSAWVGGALAHWRGPDSQAESAPGPEAVEALMDLLARQWELRPAMWGAFRREQAEFIRLTEEQFRVLDLLNQHRRALISGCAGSGKTTLAVEKARRLARSKFRVLFTCYNKSLAADLRRKLPDDPLLDIFHFHELCYEKAEETGVLPPMPPDGDHEATQRFFEQQLPEALLAAADRLPDWRYDAIVVDEGQDFQEDWWIPLQTLLHHPDQGILYIFYDDNQRLYDRPNTFPVDEPPFSLHYNCRNTQTIHRQVLKFYKGQGTSPDALGPQGRPVEVIPYGDANQFVEQLSAVLRRLTQDEQVPNDEVVVLTPLRNKSWLWSDPVPGPPVLVDRWPPGADQIFASTIHSFKGLESAVIVLVEAERWPEKGVDLESLLYVACSRARHHLIVLQPAAVPANLQPYFA